MPLKASTLPRLKRLDGDRHVMSCGLCGFLQRELGNPPFVLGSVVDGSSAHAKWDLQPFGIWFANEAMLNRESLTEQLNFVTSNSVTYGSFLSFLSGYLSESSRLLSASPIIEHVAKMCKPMLLFRDSSPNDCAHASGTGFFQGCEL